MTPLTWSATRPTVPGWYWYRENRDDASHIIEVGFVCAGENDEQQLETLHDDFDYAVNDLTGSWAGPIKLPEETI